MRNCGMAHRPTLERWTALLRPLFPAHAETQLRPRLGELRFRWPPRRAVAIFIAPNAISDYRNAPHATQSTADRNLVEFVKANLSLLNEDHRGEFKIVVASIDFVPLR